MPVGLGAAAEAMRRILIERARSKGRQKRGGGMTRGDLDSGCAAVQSDPFDLLALDEALTRLTADEPRKSELVTLRFFGGISMVEAANVPGVSLATAERDWMFAKSWWFAELADEPKCDERLEPT